MKDYTSASAPIGITMDFAKAPPIDFRSHGFGIGGIHPAPPPANVVAATAAFKPRMVRVFLQEFFSPLPAPGRFDWSLLDAYLQAVADMGGGIMASICFKPPCLFPAIDEDQNTPTDPAAWQALIAACVARYSLERPWVTHWAILNEVNIGEWGGCPHHMPDPAQYLDFYALTAPVIREVFPAAKLGGPSYAGWGEHCEDYLRAVAVGCRERGLPLDFLTYNIYEDGPAEQLRAAQGVADAARDFGLESYITELNIGIGNEPSIQEKAADATRVAALAGTLIALHAAGVPTGTFHYHLYDQTCDPALFAPFFARTRYMAEHWNDIPHRLGLFDQRGLPRPAYTLYQWLYDLPADGIGLDIDGEALGVAARDGAGATLLLTNPTDGDLLAHVRWADGPAGFGRLTVDRIVGQTISRTEDRTTYAHNDFHFDLYLPAGSLTRVAWTPDKGLEQP